MRHVPTHDRYPSPQTPSPGWLQPTNWRTAVTDRRIALALKILQKEHDRIGRAADLAKRLNLSESRFRHLFVKQTGISPDRFLRQVRLERARTLLETSFLTIKEIVHSIGYTDASHFTRDYSARYHFPPGRYRALFFGPRSHNGQEIAGSVKSNVA